MRHIFILTIVLTLLALGCNTTPRSPTPTVTPTPTPTPALTAQQIIQQASANTQALNSFHFELEQTGGTPIAMGLALLGASGDIVRPGKTRMTISASFSNMSLKVQVITVGDKTYMTNPLSGQWELLPVEFNAVKLFDPDTGLKAIMAGMTSLSRLPDEDVSGVACYRLRGMLLSGDLRAITSGSAVEGISVPTDVWIGKSDSWPRQVKVTGTVVQGEQSDISRTLRFSNFNQQVSIEAPF
ncbi:MAG: LppX_LprAFG lipoprotein [Chloroflexi bacterium]|nr:LppX_LprAFG lipoprotein [Chloroflexota bacterium]